MKRQVVSIKDIVSTKELHLSQNCFLNNYYVFGLVKDAIRFRDEAQKLTEIVGIVRLRSILDRVHTIQPYNSTDISGETEGPNRSNASLTN